jgi:hypothetical protein
MAFTALESPYILDDASGADLVALEQEGSAPVSSKGFVSKAASVERLVELVSLMRAATTAPVNG